MELCQAHAVVSLHGLIEETTQHFDGIGTLLVDVIARMAANKSLQLGSQEKQVGSSFTLEGEFCRGVAATGT